VSSLQVSWPKLFLIFHMGTTCTVHLILRQVITLIIMRGKVSRLRSVSLCSRLQPPATSFHLDQNIFLSTLFSNILNLLPTRYDLVFCFRNLHHLKSHPFKVVTIGNQRWYIAFTTLVTLLQVNSSRCRLCEKWIMKVDTVLIYCFWYVKIWATDVR
jgi:hypothetical protein